MWLCFIPLSVVSWSDQNFLMILEETFNFSFRFSLYENLTTTNNYLCLKGLFHASTIHCIVFFFSQLLALFFLET